MFIKAVAFDIDGTLYQERRFMLRHIPLVLRSPLICWGFARARRDIREYDFYEPPLHREQARRVLQVLGKTVNDEHIGQMQQRLQDRLYRHWDRLFVGMKPFNAVRSALEQLKQDGFLLAAMSDFPVGNKLSELGLEDLFLLSFSAEDVGYLKPSRMPFITLADELGCTPREVLYVGNSITKDILGAREAGMHTALYTSSPDRAVKSFAPDQLPDIMFSSYKDLPGEVARLQQGLGS